MIVARYKVDKTVFHNKQYKYDTVINQIISFPHCETIMEAIFEMEIACNSSIDDKITLPDGRTFYKPDNVKTVWFSENKQFIGIAS